jgi:RNA polymerase sigma-70 factor (ECF subfamily)
LPEDYREVIRLRVVLELPTETVASWMGRSPGAVRVLLHRALKELNEHLESDGK